MDDADNLQQRIARICSLPLHRYMGLTHLTAKDGVAELALMPDTEGALNPAGMLHGGVLYTLSDACAYAAALSLIAPTQEAVTHDLHLSVLRAGKRAVPLSIRAEVRKCGRSVAFIQVETVDPDGRLMATATVTKSIIALPGTPSA